MSATKKLPKNKAKKRLRRQVIVLQPPGEANEPPASCESKGTCKVYGCQGHC